MSTSNPSFIVTKIADADLRTKQGLMVKFSDANEVNVAGDAEDAHGVLLNEPNTGEAALIQIGGIAKVIAGGSITAPDNVGVDAAGKVVAPSQNDVLVGVALTDAAAGEWCEVLLGYRGKEP